MFATRHTGSPSPTAEVSKKFGYGGVNEFITPLIVLVWGCLIAVGFIALLFYHNTPGTRSDSNPVWQVNRLIELDPSRANLLVFIHPQCPCSTATMGELARIQAACGSNVLTHLILYQPDNEKWSTASMMAQAIEIPNLHILADPKGNLAKQFGAETSGHAMLFAPDGHRIFSGGITAGRGCEGDNPGRQAVISYVNQHQVFCDKASVYGCPIVEGLTAKRTETKEPARAIE
ncbi:hypothetical protein GCM10023155_14820 [Bremerella cremea]